MPEHSTHEVIRADLVVVGGGVAGLTAALEVGKQKVHVLSKSSLSWGSSSVWAQGGVAAAIGENDSPLLHTKDTLEAGADFCQADRVQLLTANGVDRLRKLIASGAEFDRNERGEIALGREGAHSRRRILHAGGDATGAAIVRALAGQVHKRENLRLFEHARALELAVEDNQIVGVWTVDRAGTLVLHSAPAVIMATGGLGQLFKHSTNPTGATGDGLALAFRAGAVLTDLEFVQFHPTALKVGADPMPLVTEAIRGEGAKLVDHLGHRFMLEKHPQAELAPRDVVARAIRDQQNLGRTVYLDSRDTIGEAFPSRFPTVFASCQKHGLDPRQDPIPVSPAAHYHIGGIAVDTAGKSSLKGLWACGEVTSTGVHGANRLASNSLLEALVFGALAAESIASGTPTLKRYTGPPPDQRRGARSTLSSTVRELMWNHVGLVRKGPDLQRTVGELSRLSNTPDLSIADRDFLTVAKLVATAAHHRKESRGVHYRSDHPAPSLDWKRQILFRRDSNSASGMDIQTREVTPQESAVRS